MKQCCTCLYFTSNGKAAIAQESVVFQRGNPKKPSTYCRYGGSGGGAFISVTFSILRALFVICSVLIAEAPSCIHLQQTAI